MWWPAQSQVCQLIDESFAINQDHHFKMAQYRRTADESVFLNVRVCIFSSSYIVVKLISLGFGLLVQIKQFEEVILGYRKL